MTIEVRRADTRFRTDAAGRVTRHGFSFGEHYDPRRLGFGALTAHNDERLAADGGYPAHRHEGVEIVSVVLTGALRHTSEVGAALLGPGSVQRLRAGSGVTHAEAADGTPTRFVQSWLRSAPGGEPAYEHGRAALESPGQGWTPLAGPTGVVGCERATLWAARAGALPLPEARLLHVFVADGSAQLGERLLEDGDTALLRDEGGRRIQVDGLVLVWAMADERLGSGAPDLR